MSGQLGTQFRGLILETKEELLFENNVSPKGAVETNVPTNDLSSQTINIGYSILSENPAKINKAIQMDKYNVKKVLLTKSYDCTLRGTLTEDKHIHSWKTSDDVLPFKKTIYSGTKPGHISSNFDLWNRQLEVTNKVITRWASTTSYSGSFASSLVSLNMGDYDIVFSDSSDQSITKYKVNNCEELLRVLKVQSGLPLVYIPKYEATSCFHMPWTSFNKRTLLDLMISVNGVVNSPVAKSQYGDNFTSTLCEPPEDSNPDYANEGAYTAYETNNPTASNYVRIMNNVFVDAFEPVDDVPTLLQLVFFTDFFFELKQEDEHHDETDSADDCDKAAPTRYNPDTMVSAPLEASH
jgi:hypothetical protein